MQAEAEPGPSLLGEQFTRRMGHELRSPLAAVLGYAEVLHKQHFGTLNERQARAVQGIGQSGHQLLTLINDMVDLARAEADTLDLVLAPTAIGDLCEGLLLAVMSAAEARQVRLALRLDPTLRTVVADAARLQQILRSMLRLAIALTPEEGLVVLETSTTTAGICLTVHDEAALEQAKREELLRPFASVVGLPAELTLALPLAALLARRHGGELRVATTGSSGGTTTLLLGPGFSSQARPLLVPCSS